MQAIWTDYRMNGGQYQEVIGMVVKTANAGGLQTHVGARLYCHPTAASSNRVQPFVGVNWIRNGIRGQGGCPVAAIVEPDRLG